MRYLSEIKYRGQRFGEYTIKEMVGEGRYGLCFLASNDVGQKVIIKKFKKGFLTWKLKKSMFEAEAVILSKLRDNRIPELLGVVNKGSFYGFILEWKPGVTVRDMLFKYKHEFEEDEFFNIGIKLISIIKYLHHNGIVHRDIRIPNVLLNDGDVYLIDFGLARFADSYQYKYDLDFSYLGDFLLYLLYSTFHNRGTKGNSPWYKELPLKTKQQLFLKRLMGLEVVYQAIDEIEKDFIDAFGTKD